MLLGLAIRAMHTLPGVRTVAIVPGVVAHGATVPGHTLLPCWPTHSSAASSSSSQSFPRRLLPQPSGTAHTVTHASLPRIGVVAVPDESLAAAVQPQQQQQQQQAPSASRRPAQYRRTTHQLQQQQQAGYDQPAELHQQLMALQQATQQQQQQQELWLAQAQSRQAGSGAARIINPQAAAPRTQRPPIDRQQLPQQQQHRQYQQRQQQYQQDGGMQQYPGVDQAGPRRQQQQRRWQQEDAGGFQQQRQGPGRWPQQQQQQSSRQGAYRQQDRQQDWQQQQQQQQQRRPYSNSPGSRVSSGDTPANNTTYGSREPWADSSSTRSSSSQLRFTYGLDQDWSLPTGLAVTYLGSSSGAPTRDRNVSCTVLRMPKALYLVDCGEGSSRQAKLTGMQLEQVDTIFITHLHGDHCFGIGTMLVAMDKARQAAAAAANSGDSSAGVEECPGPDHPMALRLVGPPRVSELVSTMLFFAGVGRQLTLPLYITEFVEDDSEAHDWQPLQPPQSAPAAAAAGSSCQVFLRRLAPTKQLRMQDWPKGLNARLDRTGLHWQSKKRSYGASWEAKAGLLWELPCQQAVVTAAQLQHRVPCWGYVFDERLQPDAAAAADGSSSSSRGSSVRGRRVVLLGDTVDSRPIAPVAHGADLVSHEATFAAGMEEKAAMAQHSTAWMAGQFAYAIMAKALVLTHFSARYEGSGLPRARGGVAGNGSSSRFDSNNRGGDGRGSGSDDAAEAEATERSIKALQREADDQYGLGPVLLAIDLLTAHVPKPAGAEGEEGQQ